MLFTHFMLIFVMIMLLLIFYRLYNKSNKKITLEKIDSKFDNKLIYDLNLPISEFVNLNDIYKYQYNNLDVDYYKNYIENEMDENDILKDSVELFQEEENVNDINAFPANVILELGNNIHNNNDNQSVHDSFIQKKTKHDYTHQNIKDDNLSKDIPEFIKSHNLFNDRRTVDIMNTVNDIKNRDAYITNYNTTEYNILKDIFYNYTDNNIKTQLLNELIDCKDTYNTLYCPTGVSTRLVESIYINKPMDSPKTQYILNQEILNKAAKLRENNLSLDNNKFKQKLIKVLENDYKNIMDTEQINNSIIDWIDHI